MLSTSTVSMHNSKTLMNLRKLLCISSCDLGLVNVRRQFWKSRRPTDWLFPSCLDQTSLLKQMLPVLLGKNMFEHSRPCRQHSSKVEIGLTRFTLVSRRDQGMPHQGTGRSRVPDSITRRQGESTMEPRRCDCRVYTRLERWTAGDKSAFNVLQNLQAKFFSSS